MTTLGTNTWTFIYRKSYPQPQHQPVMQIQTDIIGLKKSLSQASPISKRTGRAFYKMRPNVTKVSSIAIELNRDRTEVVT